MKEMLTIRTTKGETTMKKTFFVAVMAMALIVAFATPAFAKYAGYSSTKQYVPWAEAQSLASANADAALMARGPHAGYATTTVKCAVCHSVHRAGGKLLNEGSACAYCHTSVANQGGAVASNLISWNGVTNAGPHSGRCTNDDCHGGPHGVGSSIYDGPASKLISAKADANMLADLTANGLPVSTLDTWNAQTRAIATGGLCSRSGCHTNSMFGVVTAGAAADRSVGTTKTVTGHRVIAAATTNWNANGTDFPTTKTNLTIAFKPVDYCNSCHDLVDDNNGGKEAFPHGINDVVSATQGKAAGTRPAVWLTAGSGNDVPQVVGSYNQYTGGSTITSAAGSSIIDGTCLKCHVSGAAGVGLTY